MPARAAVLRSAASHRLSHYLIDFQSVVSELRNRSGRILLHET
jgi:hypothetical protein